MRKLLVSLALGLAAVAVVMAAPASASTTLDKVDGDGVINALSTPLGPFPSFIHVNAKSDPNGDNPQGQFIADIGGGLNLHLEGNVTCLYVTGNSATIGSVVTVSSRPELIPVGTSTIGRHVDNGQGSKATAPDEVGTAILFGFPPPTLTTCITFSHLGTQPIDSGNYTVQDAS